MSPTTKIALQSTYQPNYTHPIGTPVVLVESLDPEFLFWLVEVRVSDESLEGGAWYEYFEVESKNLDFEQEVRAALEEVGRIFEKFSGRPLDAKDVGNTENAKHKIPRVAA